MTSHTPQPPAGDDLVARLRAAYTAWNNPPSEGLPTDAGCVLEAADRIEALTSQQHTGERDAEKHGTPRPLSILVGLPAHTLEHLKLVGFFQEGPVRKFEDEAGAAPSLTHPFIGNVDADDLEGLTDFAALAEVIVRRLESGALPVVAHSSGVEGFAPAICDVFARHKLAPSVSLGAFQAAIIEHIRNHLTNISFISDELFSQQHTEPVAGEVERYSLNIPTAQMQVDKNGLFVLASSYDALSAAKDRCTCGDAIVTKLEARAEAAERQRNEALGWAGDWHRQCQTVATILGLPEPDGETHAAAVRDKFDAVERQRDALQEVVNFVWRWTWYKDGNGTSDAERLDAIKHHPGISALSEGGK